jgi:hypothetical protein
MIIEENGKKSIQDFAIIIGAMKSGTTTLFNYLIQHQQIAGSRQKEPNFFRMKTKWARGKAFYLRQWPGFDPTVHRYALEASTNYTKAPASAAVPRRIGAFGGNFRYIYILRNPIDRIESHVAHNIAKGRTRFDAVDGRLPRHVVQVSRYAYQLDTFRAALGDPEILLLDFDALRAAPLAVAERCVEFLGLEPFAFAAVEPANTRKSENRASEFRLAAEQRALLARRLRRDVRRLRDHYGFDVSGWGIL